MLLGIKLFPLIFIDIRPPALVSLQFPPDITKSDNSCGLRMGNRKCAAASKAPLHGCVPDGSGAPGAVVYPWPLRQAVTGGVLVMMSELAACFQSERWVSRNPFSVKDIWQLLEIFAARLQMVAVFNMCIWKFKTDLPVQLWFFVT